MKKSKLLLTILFAYISAVGLVTFSLFIVEESIQTAMFGTWPAKDIGAWHIVKEGADLMNAFSLTGKVINYGIGWIQPLAFVSYRAYFKSADFYTKSLYTQCLAKQPELFINEQVEFKFKPKYIKQIKDDVFVARNGRIKVMLYEKPDLRKFITVSGILKESMVIDTK